MTGVTYSGAVTGPVRWAFDSAFRLTTETINNALPQTFAYDNDDLLIQAGALTLTRDPESGRVTHAQAGVVAEDWAYNLYGEVESYAAVANGTPLLAFVYERDDLGRITKKTETSDGGITTLFEYQYDEAGRLTAVLEDGALAESYAYDANGNRTSSLNAAGVFNATFDVQDRIESATGSPARAQRPRLCARATTRAGGTAGACARQGGIPNSASSSGVASPHPTAPEACTGNWNSRCYEKCAGFE